MIIKLPWIDPIDTLNLPEDFDELVTKSFHEFTKGTAKDYEFEDKLLYLDILRERYLYPEEEKEAVARLIGESVKYELETYGEVPDKDEILSVEFMEQCYREGSRPLRNQYERYSRSANTKTLKVILRIVQIIVNYNGSEYEGGAK